MKGAGHLDWVSLDQIYNTIMEEWPSMRHNAVLDGDSLCERSDLIGGGLGFASSCLIKGREWKNWRLLMFIIFSEYMVCLDIYLSLAI